MSEKKHGQPDDDVSQAPESGTVRNSTSGNQPADRGNDPGQGNHPGRETPAVATEER